MGVLEVSVVFFRLSIGREMGGDVGERGRG